MSNTQKTLTVEELRDMHGELVWDAVVKDWGEVRMDLVDSLSSNYGIVLYRNTPGCCGFTHKRFYSNKPDAEPCVVPQDLADVAQKSPEPETPMKATFGDWLAWLGLVGFTILFFGVIIYKMKLDGLTLRSQEDYSGWLVLAVTVITAVCLLIASPFGAHLTGWVKGYKTEGDTADRISKLTNYLILVCVIVQFLLLLFGVIDLQVAKKILAALVIFSAIRNVLLKRNPLMNLSLALVGVMQFM